MNFSQKNLPGFLIIFCFGLIPGIVCQFFAKEPVKRDIHITSFRYGKDPYIIRCNRGDTLHLTFSTEDTGHSFFLEEFDIDVKVSPARDEVSVFKTSDPTLTPVSVREVSLIAGYTGIGNYLNSKSNYRCHVWCGPMHAFEQGKLIILPNTLLVSSLGWLAGILLLWIVRTRQSNTKSIETSEELPEINDLLKTPLLRKLVQNRWPQLILIFITLVMIYIVILTSVFGTKMSGRNLGVLLMWAVWLFVLVAILTPVLGRFWCTVCPLPFFGDMFQRRSFFNPVKGRTKEFTNKYAGFFLKWPAWLSNDWLRVIVFLIFATFSTTLIATPWISGVTVLILLLVPTLMAVFWEHRAFCRYVCPVSVFVAPFSRMSPVALRNKDQNVCDQCKAHFCEKGNYNGWACPYGINVGKLKGNSDCGLCLECLRTCSYNNVSIFRRPFASETGVRTMSEAWLTIAIFTVAIIYSILYLGPWPIVRDYVNILDKNNWDLFGRYAIILWSSVLIVVPMFLYLLAIAGNRFSGTEIKTTDIFFRYAGSLLPLGLMLWIAFVVPMMFVNITFIIQSASDPFGWGWDFFGTANIPWHQFLPHYIPWIQAFLILSGSYLSLRNVSGSFADKPASEKIRISLPICLFIIVISTVMLMFFTN